MSAHDKPSNQRLDAQMQVLAIAEGLGIPDPASWTWLEPGQLKLICQAIAKQAAQSERLRAALVKIGTMSCVMGYDRGHAGIDAVVREALGEAAPRDETAPADETNRDKALRGEVVVISEARLREMREQAIRFEGIGDGTYHWHWAAALNELIALREPVQQVETTAEHQS